jgi:hypothetical protein
VDRSSCAAQSPHPGDQSVEVAREGIETMKTDKGITLAVIVFTIVAMFTLNFAMTRYGTPALADGVSGEITSSIPK